MHSFIYRWNGKMFPDKIPWPDGSVLNVEYMAVGVILFRGSNKTARYRRVGENEIEVMPINTIDQSAGAVTDLMAGDWRED